jgi:hypothetical protein
MLDFSLFISIPEAKQERSIAFSRVWRSLGLPLVKHKMSSTNKRCEIDS